MILGHEISGRVTEDRLRRLSEVASRRSRGNDAEPLLRQMCQVMPLQACEYRCYEGAGVGHALNGGFAEYVKLPETLRCAGAFRDLDLV